MIINLKNCVHACICLKYQILVKNGKIRMKCVENMMRAQKVRGENIWIC